MSTRRWFNLGSCLLLCALTACSLDGPQAAPAGARRQQVLSGTSESTATGLPTPTFVPTSAAQPAGRAAAIDTASGATIRLDDTAWEGGYRKSGNSIYGGRTATWIYGTTTQYSTMQARFAVEGQPFGTAQLSIEGMDSEGPAKTPIRITVNDVTIFEGPDPLPDDDLPLESGTWATHTWEFDAKLLHSGENVISISNLAPGAFSLPPFFMLDYADLTYESP